MKPWPLLLALAACAAACGKGENSASDIPPIPASHDPKGADLIEGAVIAATESSGGVRLNKIVHVDDFPAPLDYEFHMIAYDPKAQTWEEAARLWKSPDLKIIIPHFTVRRGEFLKRDYRVLYQEKVTAEERAPYERSKRTYADPPR
jgi:hypothetical protein